MGGQRHAPAALPLGKTRYSFNRRLGGHQGQSGEVRKISPRTGIRSPDRPARSESLYLLSYPGPHIHECNKLHYHSVRNTVLCVYIYLYTICITTNYFYCKLLIAACFN